uniref:Uncharacterized protein n=1 Tax=Klebsiella pneumoniae TaxID=573 RepID=A0A6M3HES1_KLEPN|nr:hypothetical protein [Klebsiella pneumoniae]
MSISECRENVDDRARRERFKHSKPHEPGLEFPRGADLRCGVTKVARSHHRLLKEALTFWSQPCPRSRTLEERKAKLALKQLHTSADGGLRYR